MLVLGMIPAFLVALTKFPRPLVPERGAVVQILCPRLSGDIWLLVGGGVMMILGLLALLLN
jgi:hypothetical protein